MIGTTLSHYLIEAELGRGGMGIVYKAQDTKLDRTVAIKVLPSAALASKDDRERFYREAKSAAQLHHPNIASVFEIDEAVPDGGDSAEPRPFIAMEFISGETLQELVSKGPMKLADAVNVVAQVADALKAAHAKDIVHRDIKSANVMITEDGVAKVLDFGLAKTNQSTMLTRMGSTLGTVSYMSPEQARGQEVDGRTDLYSLGTMLYEMVAGRLPFSGEYEQAVVYSILNQPPEPLTSLRTGVPMQLEWIVNKLLAKDAEYRYQTAADLLADLKSLDLSGSGLSRRTMPAMSAASESAQPASKSGRMPLWGWGAVFFALVLGGAGAWMTLPDDSSPDAVIRSNIVLGSIESLAYAIDISPSGRLLAYSNGEQVRIRNLQTGEEWAIEDTQSITALQFNRSEDWLLLEASARIYRVQVRGGAPILVKQVGSNTASPHWGPDGTVIYQNGSDIESVSLTSGEVTQVVAGVPEYEYDDMFVTDDGKTLILAGLSTNATSVIRIYDLPSGKLRGDVAIEGISPWYVSSGHLLYTVDGRMFAVPIDIEAAKLTGPIVPLYDSVVRRAAAVSDNGHLFYVKQSSVGRGLGGDDLSFKLMRWDGSTEALSPEKGNYNDFDLHPDGRRVIVEDYDSSEDLWTVDLKSGVRNRLTMNDSGDEGNWYPRGDSVLYVNRSGGGSKLVIQSSDGSGQPRIIFETTERIADPSVSSDGKKVVFESDGNLWVLDVESGEGNLAFDGAGTIHTPRISPDDRFVTYSVVNNTETVRIGMQPLDFSGASWDVSRGLGFDAAWSSDGRTIYYRTLKSVFRVTVSPGGTSLSLGNPEEAISLDQWTGDYDVLPDGSGIVMVQKIDESDSESKTEVSGIVEVAFNWLDELKTIAPVSQ